MRADLGNAAHVLLTTLLIGRNMQRDIKIAHRQHLNCDTIITCKGPTVLIIKTCNTQHVTRHKISGELFLTSGIYPFLISC